MSPRVNPAKFPLHALSDSTTRLATAPGPIRGPEKKLSTASVRNLGYSGLKGYRHDPIVIAGSGKTADELLPRVHRVVSLLKRWMLGTHQGAVSHKHLDYCLDEFTFRFNRRTSASRGKLFYRLVQQATQVEPHPHQSIVHPHG